MKIHSIIALMSCAVLLGGSFAACDKNKGIGTNENICDDGIDNDGDGLTDCADPDCAESDDCQILTEVNCADATDNDGDGLTDCDDPDCFEDPDCATDIERNCADNLDNDEDGLIDCLDPDCSDATNCQGVEQNCNDGQDNDEDGLIDCLDPDCANAPNCQATGETCADVLECSYGCGSVENYNCLQACGQEGCDSAQTLIQDVLYCAAMSCYQECQTDLQDAGCQSCIGASCSDELAACLADDCPVPTTETNCTDEEDNDLDGDTDCEDTDCADHPSCLTEELTCSGVFTCAESCGTDYQCVQACRDAGCQSAQQVVDALLQTCGQSCGMTCMGGLGSAECQTCLASSCPNEYAACQEDDCTGTFSFEWSCGDDADNDGDTLIDCDDDDCTGSPACQVGGDNCSEILACVDTCQSWDNQCRQACYQAGCTSAQTAFDELRTTCFGTYQNPGPCPRTMNGACVDLDSQTCIDCMSTNCSTDYTACLSDTCL